MGVNLHVFPTVLHISIGNHGVTGIHYHIPRVQGRQVLRPYIDVILPYIGVTLTDKDFLISIGLFIFRVDRINL